MAEYKGSCKSKAAFKATAKPVSVTLSDGQTLIAEPRVFASGKVGYFASGKLMVGGERIQGNVSLVVIGSETLPDGQPK